MFTRAEIGAAGERVAAQWLVQEGFEILNTNWRAGRYELDIVARKGMVVHFVEVKTRQRSGLTRPEDAITEAKFRSLRQAAGAYLRTQRLDCEVQFDLIAVEYWSGSHEIRYVPNAMICRW